MVRLFDKVFFLPRTRFKRQPGKPFEIRMGNTECSTGELIWNSRTIDGTTVVEPIHIRTKTIRVRKNSKTHLYVKIKEALCYQVIRTCGITNTHLACASVNAIYDFLDQKLHVGLPKDILRIVAQYSVSKTVIERFSGASHLLLFHHIVYRHRSPHYLRNWYVQALNVDGKCFLNYSTFPDGKIRSIGFERRESIDSVYIEDIGEHIDFSYEPLFTMTVTQHISGYQRMRHVTIYKVQP